MKLSLKLPDKSFPVHTRQVRRRCGTPKMGILYTKTGVPASENQRAEGGRTPEAHGTQPASETPSGVSQVTAQVYRVEDSIQQSPQEGNEGHILVLSEGAERRGPRGASRERNQSRILVLSEGTEGRGPQGASREGNEGHILVLSEGTERRGPQGASRERNQSRILVLSEGMEEHGPRGASREGNEGHILVLSEGTEERGPQEASRGGSETPSLPGTSGSSEVACVALEESEIIPDLIELIEKFMAESDASPTLTDIPCWPCQECLLREGPFSTLESDLHSSLARDLELRISEEVSEALRPPAVRTSDSQGAREESKPCKGFKDTHANEPVAEVIGAQAAGPVTQRQSPGRAGTSDTASQTVPADKDAGVDTGMTEEEEAETEIQAHSRAPGTPEKGANSTVDGQEQESVAESPERDLFWFW
ncbi:UNVERIFIED_CONTAM: hypothetical protein K2H54_017151 [Gekko kuhli]